MNTLVRWQCLLQVAPTQWLVSQIATAIPKLAGLVEGQDDLKVHKFQMGVSSPVAGTSRAKTRQYSGLSLSFLYCSWNHRCLAGFMAFYLGRKQNSHLDLMLEISLRVLKEIYLKHELKYKEMLSACPVDGELCSRGAMGRKEQSNLVGVCTGRVS